MRLPSTGVKCISLAQLMGWNRNRRQYRAFSHEAADRWRRPAKLGQPPSGLLISVVPFPILRECCIHPPLHWYIFGTYWSSMFQIFKATSITERIPHWEDTFGTLFWFFLTGIQLLDKLFCGANSLGAFTSVLKVSTAEDSTTPFSFFHTLASRCHCLQLLWLYSWGETDSLINTPFNLPVTASRKKTGYASVSK